MVELDKFFVFVSSVSFGSGPVLFHFFLWISQLRSVSSLLRIRTRIRTRYYLIHFLLDTY